MSANADEIIQSIDSIETYAYGMSSDLDNIGHITKLKIIKHNPN